MSNQKDIRRNYINDVTNTFFEALDIIDPPLEYRKAITTIVDTVSFQGEPNDKKINVIPLLTGGGKTTLIKQMLPLLYQHDLTIVGTIILVPYSNGKHDNNCTDIASEINSLAGCDIALPLDSNNMKIHRKIMRNYPILVMTHQRYRQRFRKFKDFLCWTDGSIHKGTGEPNIYYRRRLLIDEAITIMDVIEIDSTAIAELTKLFQGLQNYEDCREFESIANELNKLLEIPLDSSESKGLCHIKPNLYISDRIKKVVENHGTLIHQKYFTGINNLTVTGGYINRSKKEKFRKIYSCAYIDMFDGLYNVHIFDGTGLINELYNYDRFNILDIPIIKNYDDVQIHVNNSIQSSRSFLDRNPDVIRKTIEYIHDNLNKKKVLLITHASIENKVKELLTQYNLNDNVVVEHWNGMSGSNKYVDYDTLVFLGINYMSDIYYIFLYHLYNFNFEFAERITACTPSKGDPVKRFHDVDYENVRQSAMAVDIAQAINRVRCRKYNGGQALETHIFLGFNDKEVIKRLEKAMPGVQIINDFDIDVEEFKSVRELPPKHEVVFDRLWNHESYFPSKRKVTKSELFNGICTRKETKVKILQHPSIVGLEDAGLIAFTYKTVNFN